ncbi:unnamed protein product, partial [Porites lobata]
LFSFNAISPSSPHPQGSYSIVGALILFTCLCEMRAATVQKVFITTESFKLHIKEGMARFDETIVVDEENDIEYFKVPAHNELSESDNLYDFKMNITVSRVKSDGVCHITPLPQDLPRPNILSRGFKTLTNMPPSHKIVKTIQQWRIGARVEKQTLRLEVQEFCGRFPAYRLEPFTSDSVTVVSEDEDGIRAGKSARTRRQTGTKKFILCDNNIPPCSPTLW